MGSEFAREKTVTIKHRHCGGPALGQGGDLPPEAHRARGHPQDAAGPGPPSALSRPESVPGSPPSSGGSAWTLQCSSRAGTWGASTDCHLAGPDLPGPGQPTANYHVSQQAGGPAIPVRAAIQGPGCIPGFSGQGWCRAQGLRATGGLPTPPLWMRVLGWGSLQAWILLFNVVMGAAAQLKRAAKGPVDFCRKVPTASCESAHQARVGSLRRREVPQPPLSSQRGGKQQRGQRTSRKLCCHRTYAHTPLKNSGVSFEFHTHRSPHTETKQRVWRCPQACVNRLWGSVHHTG